MRVFFIFEEDIEEDLVFVMDSVFLDSRDKLINKFFSFKFIDIIFLELEVLFIKGKFMV